MFWEDSNSEEDILFPSKPKRRRKRSRASMEEETNPLAIMSVAALKEKCRELGLKVSGNKPDLMARIEAHQAGLPNPTASSKKGKTTGMDLSNKLREGLQHFFGETAVLAKPDYRSISARDPFSMDLLYDCHKHGEPFLDESVAETLRAILKQEEVFTMHGELELDPQISFGNMTVKFPLNDDTATKIDAMCTDAPFGKGSETVIDKSVRNCRQMNPQQFTIANKEWHKLFSTSAQSELLEQIRKELSPNNSEITAELYKFLYYPTGSFFKPHVDTQRDPNMFATLVIQLPSHVPTGGELIVQHKGVTKTFKPSNSLEWIAFYASCEHSINRIGYGTRCTLVYNLKRTGKEVEMPSQTWDSRVVAAIDKVFEFGDDEDRGENFTLGHLMDFQYAVSNVVPAVLKGIDAQLYQALKQTGKYDLLLTPLQIQRLGCGGCGEEDDSAEAESLIDEDEDPQFATWPVDPAQPVQGKRNRQSYAAFTQEALEALNVKWIEDEKQIRKARKIARSIAPTGNEGVGASMVYIHAGLLIRRKKGAEAKTFPAELGIEHNANTNTNTDNNE